MSQAEAGDVLTTRQIMRAKEWLFDRSKRLDLRELYLGHKRRRKQLMYRGAVARSEKPRKKKQ